MAASSERLSDRDGRRFAGRGAGVLAAAAGLLGACGVALSTAAAHVGGGSPLATTGGTFLLIHAAALTGLAALDAGCRDRRYRMAGWMLAVGAALFSGDLAAAGLMRWHPLPLAAPFGGVLLILGWLLVPAWAALAALRGRPAA